MHENSWKHLRRNLVLFCVLFGTLHAADDVARPNPEKEKGEGIQWKSVLLESGFFLGLQHAYRFSTEQGTREGLQGPYFGNYAASIGNLHGWADGDPFLVNYVGHPMQGAVTGFILVQNDPKGARVEYGNNAVYWKSRLKAAAYSWAYSEQFEIGPLSEASLGHVQSFFPQQGFVDHVITPVIGTGWMVAEDFLDKHVIRRVEDHTSNVFLRVILRGGLNPSRSMANMMRMKEPWYRDTRPGVVAYQPKRRQELSPVALPPDEYHPLREIPPLRLTLHYNFGQGPSASSCNGGGAEGQFQLSRHVSGVIDIAGCKALFEDKNLSGDSLTYMAGLRYSWQLTDRWTVYGQALAGGNKMTTELNLPEIKKLTNSTGEDDWISHAKYTESRESNSFSTAVGGGAEYTLTNALAFRVANVDYVHNWNGASSEMVPGDGVRVSTGIVLRLGTW